MAHQVYRVARGARLVIPYCVLEGDAALVEPENVAIQRKQSTGVLSGPKWPLPTEVRAATAQLNGGFNVILDEAFTTARDAGDYQMDALVSVGGFVEETEPATVRIFNAAASPP